jgi:hypothetical protein
VKLNIVSMAVEWVQGTLLCEMSDGTLAEFKCWGKPAYMSSCQYKTREQLVEWCREHNRLSAMQASVALYADKERRFGHNYQARGYR